LLHGCLFGGHGFARHTEPHFQHVPLSGSFDIRHHNLTTNRSRRTEAVML
jgi:hypothetical protein